MAGNGTNLNLALRRAVPALRETDGLLQLLGDENQTIKALVRDGDTVIGDLARNKSTVVRFVRSARRTAELSAERRTALAGTFRRLPAFLQELRPTMVSLGKTADNTSKTLVTLRKSSGQLKTFFADAQPFADASKPALKSLGPGLGHRPQGGRGGRADGHPAAQVLQGHAGAGRATSRSS